MSSRVEALLAAVGQTTRPCACGCGRPVAGRRTYYEPACRNRKYRKRRREREQLEATATLQAISEQDAIARQRVTDEPLAQIDPEVLEVFDEESKGRAWGTQLAVAA